MSQVGQADSSDSVDVDDKSAGNNNDGERAKHSTLGCHRHHLDGGGGSGPSDNEGGASGSGRSSLWNSPTLRRVFAPLKQSLSVSAEHIPRPKSPLSNLPWNLKQSAMAKCQSID